MGFCFSPGTMMDDARSRRVGLHHRVIGLGFGPIFTGAFFVSCYFLGGTMAESPNMTASHVLRGPLVSVGLPVFNGERYIGKAIQSILDQTLGNLELIICDNASTDSTQGICESFARKDPRVRYYRNARNFGAGPNYDQCFHRSQGKYFKWAAHDDMLAPQFLEKAVAALEANPATVLCTVGVQEIDENDRALRVYVNELPGMGSGDRVKRFACMIHTRHQCEDFFGLFRRDALIGSGLHAPFTGSDRVLLAEMALRGPWVQLREPLFIHREHRGRYTRAVLLADRRAAAMWQNTSARPWLGNALYHPKVYSHYWRAVLRNVKTARHRWSCYAELARWWFTDNHARASAADVLLAISPTALLYAQKLKRSLFGISTHPADLPPVEQ
jgi:glycosyltransferase involved in cell wall biosynthesis